MLTSSFQTSWFVSHSATIAPEDRRVLIVGYQSVGVSWKCRRPEVLGYRGPIACRSVSAI